MKRRILCLLCALALLLSAVPAAAETSGGDRSFDFDFTFAMNAASFPKLLRSRMAGYAQLINRIGLRGNIAWSADTASMELNAVLYFIDKPSVSFPFRVDGTQYRLFVSSPLLKDEVILLNMAALLEFAVKAKKTLSVDLPYLAYLFPLTTTYPTAGLVKAWEEIIGTYPEGGTVGEDQLRTLTGRWADQFETNAELRRWVQALAEGSSGAQEAVEAELTHLPDYVERATGFRPVTVAAGAGSEVWSNANGQTLYSRQETGDDLYLTVSMPATENGYEPFLSYTRGRQDGTVSFNLEATYNRQAAVPLGSIEEAEPDASSGPAPEAEEDTEEEEEETFEEYRDSDEGYYEDEGYIDTESEDSEESDEEFDEYTDEDEEYGDEDEDGEHLYSDTGESGALPEASLPDSLLHLIVTGKEIPLSLPAEGSFSLIINVLEALYPNFAVDIRGKIQKDGSLLLSVRKPDDGETEPVEILRCTGTLTPAEPRRIPDYMQKSLADGSIYNVFSFNETKLAAFRARVLPLLVRSIFSFVEAAPTASIQSLLDDLTDSGVLDMLIN